MFASSQSFHDNRCTPKIVAKLFHENLYTHKLSCSKSNLQKIIHRLFSTKLSITTTVDASGIRLSTAWTTNSTGLAHRISEATINLYIRLSRTPSHSAPSQNIWSSIGSSWDLSCWKYLDVGKIPYNPPDKVWVVFWWRCVPWGFWVVVCFGCSFALTKKSLPRSFLWVESWWSEEFGMENQGNICAPNADTERRHYERTFGGVGGMNIGSHDSAGSAYAASGQSSQELAATFAVFHPSKMTKWSSPWQNTNDTRVNRSCTRRMPGMFFVTIPACFCPVYRSCFLKLCRWRQKRMAFVASAGKDLQ